WIADQVGWSARAVVQDLVRLDPEFEIDTGDEVLGSVDPFDGSITLAVGRAHHLATGSAAACYQDGDRAGPVVAARRRCAGKCGDFRCSAKFTHHQNERCVKQTTLVEIFDEGGDHTIHLLPLL